MFKFASINILSSGIIVPTISFGHFLGLELFEFGFLEVAYVPVTLLKVIRVAEYVHYRFHRSFFSLHLHILCKVPGRIIVDVFEAVKKLKLLGLDCQVQDSLYLAALLRGDARIPRPLDLLPHESLEFSLAGRVLLACNSLHDLGIHQGPVGKDICCVVFHVLFSLKIQMNLI